MTAPVITIFVRHSADCKYAGDEFAKRCTCRKHFRWTQDGKQYRQKAGTRSWAEAEDLKRTLEDALAGRLPQVLTEKISIGRAIEVFLKDKENQGLAESSTRRYKPEMRRLEVFALGKGVAHVSAITKELLIDYRETWPALYPASSTRALAQQRLRHFLRFCHDAGWLERLPRLSPIKVDTPETQPLTRAEYAALLAAVPKAFPDDWKEGDKVRALIQTMRFTGLAVRDASTLEQTDILQDADAGHYRVVTSRQKTGIAISVPIPPDVAAEVLAVLNGNPRYVFWNVQGGTEASAAHHAGLKIARAFRAAGIVSDGHMISHRLRDTFAVEMLQAGVPMEEVSKLLGHSSISTTERHYAKWVKGRQDRLDALVSATWSTADKPARKLRAVSE